MEQITLTTETEIPGHWCVGDKIITNVGHFRIVTFVDKNNMIIRKWMWFDYIVLIYYAFYLIWLDIKNWYQGVKS